MIRGEIGENFAVKLYVRSFEAVYKFAVRHAVLHSARANFYLP